MTTKRKVLFTNEEYQMQLQWVTIAMGEVEK
jgi:hypothetical protein